MTSVIPELVDHVMEQEEVVKEKASDRPEGEEEDSGTGTQRVRLNFAKVFEDLLTVDEYELQKLEAETADPNCTCEIFMNAWVVHEEHGEKVTRYKCLFTSVNEQEVSVADPTIQDLLERAYPGNPNPPKVIHILADYPDLYEGSQDEPCFYLQPEVCKDKRNLDAHGGGPPEVVEAATEVEYEDADEKEEAEELLRRIKYHERQADDLREEFELARKQRELKVIEANLRKRKAEL
jgi:hypothetical protein